MQIISDRNLVIMLRRTLNYVDSRLVDHGSRVLYIVMSVLYKGHRFSINGLDVPRGDRPEALPAIAWCCLLHDIGAYKTNDVDDFIDFETAHTWPHAVYGYILLNKMSRLKKYSSAVLYHHLGYDKFSQKGIGDDDVAGLVNIADRLDILMASMDTKDAVKRIVEYRGTKFSPYWVDALCQCDIDFREAFKADAHTTLMVESCAQFEHTHEEKRELLCMLAYMIDFRSEFMVWHTFITQGIAMELARRMGIGGNELSNVYYGSLLHDIGKVGCSVALLDKPGPLTAEEYALMQRHVVYSEDILKGCVSDTILKIAIRHHEKLDGSGYPYGLKGDELTISQRIVAVADIASALLYKRSYKEAFSKAKVIGILSGLAENGKTCKLVTAKFIAEYDEVITALDRTKKYISTTFDSISIEYKKISSGLEQN